MGTNHFCEMRMIRFVVMLLLACCGLVVLSRVTSLNTLMDALPSATTLHVMHTAAPPQPPPSLTSSSSSKPRTKIKIPVRAVCNESRRWRNDRFYGEIGALWRTQGANVQAMLRSSVLPALSCADWWSLANEAGDEDSVAPRLPPCDALSDYTMNGRANLIHLYSDERYVGNLANNNREFYTGQWTRELVESYIATPTSGYGEDTVRIVTDTLKKYPVRGMRGVVIGSSAPWLEGFLLGKGAEHVTTIEYGDINCTHPRITALTPAAASAKFRAGTLGPFDFMFTYSSIEHSGLGRYGDRLNPWGDLETMQRAKCMLRPGAYAYVGVPVSEWDCTVFNLHRIYGPLRRGMLGEGFANGVFDIVGPIGKQCSFHSQPVLMMRMFDNIKADGN